MKMRLVFKGGAVLDVDVEEYSVTRSNFTGELMRLDWTLPDRRPGMVALKRVELGEVAAVATVWEEGDGAEADNPEPPSEAG